MLVKKIRGTNTHKSNNILMHFLFEYIKNTYCLNIQIYSLKNLYIDLLKIITYYYMHNSYTSTTKSFEFCFAITK